MFIDLTGLKPTEAEAALMVQDLYSDYDNRIYAVPFGGWKREDVINAGDGMVMGIYSKRHENGEVEYSLVSKGSLLDFFGEYHNQTVSDWINNIQGPFGVSDDIKAGIEKAEEFVKDNAKSEITFIGHSKGGAEAAANAVATNRNAILFNPMSVNLRAYGLSASNYTADMTAYIVKGEILNNIFGSVSMPIGEVVYLPSLYDNSLDNHSMNAIIKELLRW